ncbi:hypothetical protein [Kallotenue papyrolyticum]|uniref:DprA-like winged helix domain-containing protein n=1 Tax=Kallotenue papyrolyticum TaxID=1325125 RepID=UPI00049266D4|nr:hypothetical protein [Kallotenue papyrolyticum]
MPRREWSRPFAEIRAAIVAALRDGAPRSSDELVAATGLPFEDVISALRMLRHQGVLDFEPVWEREDVMRGARNIRLRESGA